MRKVAIILAGGSGSRLWPLSTEQHPKILLEIFPNKTMLEEALFRAKLFADYIFVLTKGEVYNAIKDDLKENGVHRSQVIIEPEEANTGAAITYALARIKKSYGAQVVIALLPSDSRIKNYGAFYRDIKFALKSAIARKTIVLFGTTPSFPATGYGYIKVGKKIGEDDRESLFNIDSFHEKPDEGQAKAYMKDANFLWNSGIFIGLIKVFEQLIQLNADLYAWYQTIERNETPKPIPEVLRNTLIEHDLIEKFNKLSAVIATFDWADIGSYEALYDIVTKTDDQGNSINANATIKDCKDCLIIGRDKKIVALGLNDIAVIDQPDGILICHKSTHAQIVGQIATAENQPGK